MSRTKLDRRDIAILDFIQRYTDEHGHAPSDTAIGDAVFCTRQAANRRINYMVEQGYLTCIMMDGNRRAPYSLAIPEKVIEAIAE